MWCAERECAMRGRDRGPGAETEEHSQLASPNPTSPATSTTANTDRAEEGLGSSELWNSSAEPNPSNWENTNALVAVERHRPVDRSGWLAFFGGSVGATAPRKRTLRPMGMSEAGNAWCGVRRAYQRRAGKLMIKLGPGAASVRPPTICHISESQGLVRQHDDGTLENTSIQTRRPWSASSGPAHGGGQPVLHDWLPLRSAPAKRLTVTAQSGCNSPSFLLLRLFQKFLSASFVL